MDAKRKVFKDYQGMIMKNKSIINENCIKKLKTLIIIIKIHLKQKHFGKNQNCWSKKIL